MTDVHSHIMFDVDDGSYSIEESIALIKELKSVGFDNIILTPHYIENTQYKDNKYRVANDEKEEKFNILKEAVKKEKIDINLFLGNEIFISKNIVDLVLENEIHPLANSKYLLIEFSLNNQTLNVGDVLYEIQNKGYTPIIAHPERYIYFQNNYKLVDNLKKEGILFQCNYASILGLYGKKASKLFKYMLKNKYVDYLGTDIHHMSNKFVIDNFSKIEKKIIKYSNIDYYNKIKDNCNKLVK